MKKKVSIGLRIIGVLLVLVIAIAVFLQTPPGKRMLVSGIERTLSGSDDLNVRIGTVTGWIPASIYVEDLEIGDADGVWLTSEKLHCRWKLRDLFRGRFRFAYLGAESIELRRLPRGGGTHDPVSGRERSLDTVEVILDRLNIQRLSIAKEVAGIPLSYTVQSGGIHLQPSGRMTGSLNVLGDAEGSVELDALIGGSDARLRILAELDRLVHPTLGLDHLSGQTDVEISRAGIKGMVSAEVQKDTWSGAIEVELQYADRVLRVPEYAVRIGEQSASGRLQIDFTQQPIKILLDSAAEFGSLHAQADVTSGGGTWKIDFNPLELTYSDLTAARFTGEVSPEHLALDGRLAEFDLNGLPIIGFSNFTGRVSGGLRVSGSLAEPDIRTDLDVIDFTSVEEVLDELPDLNLHISGALSQGKVWGSTVLTNSSHGSLEASFDMPCILSFDPFLFKPDKAAVRAQIDADINLDILNRLAIFSDQRLAGQLEVDLAYDQIPSGSILLHNGSYENFKWGVVLRELGFELAAEESGLRVKAASATDGASGRITMSGAVAPGKLDLSINLNQAEIVRRDDMEAMISGDLSIQDRLFHPSISGHLAVNRADILLDNIAPALPSRLVSFDALAETNKVDKIASKAPLLYSLDVEVDLANQIYVNSAMIDSIWGGHLHIRDVPEGISVEGVVKPQRGFVAFIGKNFRFTDGQVELDGAVPAVPVLNGLTSEYSRGDFSARLILEGRIDNPVLRVESTPAMPEDEILSHVLFGQEASSISTYQAFQLAAAAQQLSGRSRGPGFMFQMRQAVGVDTLEWREAAGEGEASSVAAGKYLTPSFYVEVNRTLDDRGETGMMAEYDLTRHISVETSTGAKMRPGIGVNWKNDY